MSSSLLVLVYVGLVPVTLVAGVVVAVRRRALLGSRVTRQVAAGAGLLMAGLVVAGLQPWLRNLFDGDGLTPFGSVGDLVSLLVLLRVMLQAAGIGLLLAAAVGPRPQPASDDTRPHPAAEPSMLALLSPLPSGVSRWLIAGVAAVSIGAGGAWIVSSGAGNNAALAPPTEEQQAAGCLENFAELSLPVKSKPVERMVLRKDGGWLRVFVSEPDNWITACQGGPDGPMGNFGTITESGPAGELRFFGGYDSVFKAHLLIGHMPTGGAFVEATLADGRRIAGDHDGDVFVIWAPGGLDVEKAQVTVYTQDRKVLITTSAPTE